MLAVFLNHFHGGLKVSQIIEGIENPKYIYTHITRFIYKSSNHIIGIIPLPHEILPT